MPTLDALKSNLPAPVRRRLGKVKRRVLGQPEPPVAPVRNPAAKKAPAKPAAPASPPKSRIETRREMIFASADPKGLFLEIGPAHNGTLPKRDGFNTRNVDYLDREGLVAKYEHFEQYDMDDIEEVDYVLSPDGTQLNEIPERFDLVLASHVLEHTTSLIDFINELTPLLAEEGVLAIIVPDHRYCFDRFRERSSLGRVIDTHLNPPKVHTVGTLTEFSLNAVRHRGTGAWAPNHRGKYKLIHDLEATKALAAKADNGPYIDVHNWIFSPHHLRLLLQDLAELGYISLRECFFHETIGHEFFINLRAGGPGSGLTREELLVLADAERTIDKPVFGDEE